MPYCYTCGNSSPFVILCKGCGFCLDHCECIPGNFDADELGLDPESDNTPDAEERHA